MDRRRRSGRLEAARRVLPVLVLGVVLGPLATALLRPDPLWVPGLYDGGDGDDLVQVVTRAAGSPPVIGPDPMPGLGPTAVVSPPPVASPPVAVARPARSRAPPAA